jgi:hypothetical protein
LQTFALLGHRRGIARALEGAAFLAVSQGLPERALRLAAAAAHLRQSVGAPRHPEEQFRLDQTLLPAWESVSEAAGKRAWAEGAGMTLEAAIRYALGEPAAARAAC